jgi:Transposase DDE domain
MRLHHRLVNIVKRFRNDVAAHLDADAINTACREEKHTWRDRLFNPTTTVHLFLTQVLHGNTALNHLPHLVGESFDGSSFCTARKRLPLGVLQRLLDQVAATLVPAEREGPDGDGDDGRWLDHRLFLLDGSSFSMPDTPELRHHFGQSGAQQPGCGFPTAHLMALFHAGTGALRKVMAAPLRTHDMSQVPAVHPELQPGDVVVGDRGFCSFAHLALARLRGVFGLFRVHQKQIVDFTPGRGHAPPGAKRGVTGKPRSRWLRAAGVMDQWVEYFKPEERPDWMTAEEYEHLPESLVVRELRYRVGPRGFRTKEVTLVTTLLDEQQYPATALAELYRRRWEVEGHLRELKQTMNMDILKCRSVAGVLKEMTVFALVYNLVRAVLVDAAGRQGTALRRLSFIDGLRWLATADAERGVVRIVVNPDRPNRSEPRVRKRRTKEYDLMKRPRSAWRAEQDALQNAA